MQLRKRGKPKKYDVDPFSALGIQDAEANGNGDRPERPPDIDDIDDEDFDGNAGAEHSAVSSASSLSESEHDEEATDLGHELIESGDEDSDDLLKDDRPRSSKSKSKVQRKTVAARTPGSMTALDMHTRIDVAHVAAAQAKSVKTGTELAAASLPNKRLAKSNLDNRMLTAVELAKIVKLETASKSRASRRENGQPPKLSKAPSAARNSKYRCEFHSALTGYYRGNEHLMDCAIFGPDPDLCLDAQARSHTRDLSVSRADFDILQDFDLLGTFPKMATVNLRCERDDSVAETELSLFSSMHVPNSPTAAVVMNAGFSVWGMDWCHPAPDAAENYLAVAGYNGTDEHYAVGHAVASRSMIQLWRTDLAESGLPELDMVLIHDWGACFTLQWWPVAPAQLLSTICEGHASLPRLGVLAGCFSDGHMRLFVVPHPQAVRQLHSPEGPVAIHITSTLLDVTAPDSCAFRFALGGSGMLAVGYSNGFVSLHDLDALETGEAAEPLAYFPAHDTFVTSLSFNHSDDPDKEPKQLVSTGADGRILLWDLHDATVALPLWRAHGVMPACIFPRLLNLVMTADIENMLRYIHIDDVKRTHILHGHRGCIWARSPFDSVLSIADSASHPFLASVSAEGLLKICNMNRMRTRARNPIEVTLYALGWDKQSQTLHMTDGLVCRAAAAAHMRKSNHFFWRFAPEIALQRVCWTNDPQRPTWLASAGTMGIVRIENAANQARVPTTSLRADALDVPENGGKGPTTTKRTGRPKGSKNKAPPKTSARSASGRGRGRGRGRGKASKAADADAGIGGATVWVLVLLILAQVLAVGRSLSAATAELINLAGSPQAAALLLDDFVIVDPPIVLLTDDDKRRSPYVLRLISRMYDDAAPAFVKEDKGGLQLSRVDASLQDTLTKRLHRSRVEVERMLQMHVRVRLK
ncbi:hypothetical protein RI367_006763 [Sorochytrium milnesiophthora]